MNPDGSTSFPDGSLRRRCIAASYPDLRRANRELDYRSATPTSHAWVIHTTREAHYVVGYQLAPPDELAKDALVA